MRNLFLVGMAPPTEKISQRLAKNRDSTPRSCGPLGNALVPLDPRHGVFPNHVMTPLLATLYHLRANQAAAAAFLDQQIPPLLEDISPRRFNVLKTPDGKNLTLCPSCQAKLDGRLDARSDLLLVIGYWSISSIIYYTLTGRTTFTKAQVNAKSEDFLRGVLAKLADAQEHAPFGIPQKRTPRPGVYFRLLTCSNARTPEVIDAIKQTIDELRETNCDAEGLARIYRSLVPLPHDEAYKNKPVGKFQNCFMLGSDPDRHADSQVPPQVFWRYVGSVIARRLLVGEDPLR